MLKYLERYAQNLEDRAPAERRIGLRERLSGLVATFGLVCNLLLTAAKFLAAILSNSLALMGDAINNLTDSVSSVVGIIGVRLSAKKPDAAHPFGYKRTEYISSTVVAAMILTVAFNLALYALDRFRHPAPLEITLYTFLPLIFSILLKLLMWQTYRTMAKHYAAPLFNATALDSISDVLTSMVTLVALVSARFSDFPFDALAALASSLFIAWQGIKLLKETLNQLLGAKPDQDLHRQIVALLEQDDSLLGWHDLIIHNYGPGRDYATCHVEVPEQAPLHEVHDVIDYLERKAQLELGVQLLLHIDPRTEFFGEERRLQKGLSKIVRAIDCNLDLHDLRIEKDRDHYDLIFDLNVPDACPLSDEALRERLNRELHAWRSDVKAFVTLDHHYASSTEALDTTPPQLRS